MQLDPAFSAIIQGGSFALLAYLVVWGIPSWIREFRAERTVERAEREKDREEREMERTSWVMNFSADREMDRAAATSAVARLMEAFKLDQRDERASCERRHAEAIEAIRETHEAVEATAKETRHAINGLANQAGLKRVEWERTSEKAHPRPDSP